MENQTISWQAPEFRHYEKNIGWYVALLGTVVLIIGFFVIIENDIFGAISLGIMALLLLYFARQKPLIVEIELNHKGLKFGTLFFPYKQLKDFWVVHNDNHKTLNLRSTTYVNNLLIIELEDQDPDEIRLFLLQYLPEHEQVHETFVQRISHKLKF